MINESSCSPGGQNPWKEKMNMVLDRLVYRMQYRDVLDDNKNWVKQLFY